MAQTDPFQKAPKENTDKKNPLPNLEIAGSQATKIVEEKKTKSRNGAKSIPLQVTSMYSNNFNPNNTTQAKQSKTNKSIHDSKLGATKQRNIEREAEVEAEAEADAQLEVEVEVEVEVETEAEAEARRKKIAAAARAFALAPSPNSLPKRKSTRGIRSSKKSLQMSPPPPATPTYVYNRKNRTSLPYNPSMPLSKHHSFSSNYSTYSPPNISLSNNKKEKGSLSKSKILAHNIPIQVHLRAPSVQNNFHISKDKNGDEDEDEYAKFVRSLCDTSDLASIISFPVPDDHDDDEASYQLPDDDEEEDDFDEFFDSNSIFSNLDMNLKDGQLMENDALDFENSDVNKEKSLKKAMSTESNEREKRLILSSLVDKSKNVDESITNTNNTGNVESDGVQKNEEINYNELKEELGNLIEEEIEASLATLLQQPIHPNNSSMSTPKSKISTSISSEKSVSTPDSSKTLLFQANNLYGNNTVSPFVPKTSKTYTSPSIARQRKNKVVAAAARAASTIFPSSNLEPLTPTTNFETIKSIPDSGSYHSSSVNYEVPSMKPPLAPSSHTTSPQTPNSDGSVSFKHISQLHSLMKQHYQLLLQQSILAVRTAHHIKKEKEKTKLMKDQKPGKKSSEKGGKDTPKKRSSNAISGETQDEIKEMLDGAVVMLQDLDQNRKDSIRNSIAQVEKFDTNKLQSERQQRLTRSAFTKSLLERDCFFACPSPSPLIWRGSSFAKRSFETSQKLLSIFDVKGLGRLSDTFSTLDNSVNCNGKVSIMGMTKHSDACSFLLKQAGADIDHNLIPGSRDLSTLLTFPKECFGTQLELPLSEEKQLELRQNRDQFSASEDNLLLRGVNLYGEKEWLSVSDRYLPDRSLTFISHRYSKLCFLLYISQGIYIDEEGNLETPPEHPDGVENFDEEAISKLESVEEPYKYNVHRWSLKEDVTILKSVPLMGRMWAEMSNRLIKHRNRGHIRKRYQVLERRVKGAIKRNKNADIKCLLSTESKYISKPAESTPNLASGESDISTHTPDVSKNDDLIKSSSKKRQNTGMDLSNSGVNKFGPLSKKSKIAQNRFALSEYSRLPPKMLPMIRSENLSNKSSNSAVMMKENETLTKYEHVASRHQSVPNTPSANTVDSSTTTKGTPNLKGAGNGTTATRYSSKDSFGNRKFVMTPSKEGKSPITILSSRSPYTPSNISVPNIEGEEELICEENMESLPADASLMGMSPKDFFTPSSVASLSNSEKKSKPVKRSLKCSPQESTPKSMSSVDFDKILKDDVRDLSMMSDMKKMLNDGDSLAQKSNFKIESKMMNDGLLSRSQHNSSVMLERLPNLSTDMSNFSILNMSKDASKAILKESNHKENSAYGKPGQRNKNFFETVIGVGKEKQIDIEGLNQPISKDVENHPNMKEIDPPLGEMSALSFSRLGNETKDMLQITGTATQLIAGDASIGGLSDFGITNQFKFSETSMNVIQGKAFASRLPKSTDSATSTTITEYTQSVGKNLSSSLGRHSLFDANDANAASALSALQSRVSFGIKAETESKPKRQREDSRSTSLFAKVMGSAVGKKQRKEI